MFDALLTIALWGLIACALIVFLTHVTAWYEYANNDPSLIHKRFDRHRLLPVLTSALRETWVLFHLLPLWPFGFFPRRNHAIETDRTPVVLLNGLFQNRTCFWWLRRQLKAAGHPALCVNLFSWQDLETQIKRVENAIDGLQSSCGVAQVVLVGHSMGGMIAREYVQRRNGALRVRHVVQIGSPNKGSKLAPFACSPLGALLIPGSDFLTALAEAELPPSCPVTSIYSRRDTMVLPAKNCQIDGGENIEIDGLGHNSLLFSARVVAPLLATLSKERP